MEKKAAIEASVSDLTENLKAMQAQRKEKETEINLKGDILKGLNKNIEELWKVAAF
jgi:peptidoglycan hydrolase CwlO-like protein